MFQKHISNNYLNEDRVITAKTQIELEQKIHDQCKRWQAKEEKVRQQREIDKLKDKAIIDSKSAIKKIEEYKNLLQDSLKQKHTIKWEKLYTMETYQVEEPRLDIFIELLNVPKEDKFLEFIFSSIRTNRLEKQKEAEEQYQHAVTEFNRAKSEFLNNQNSENDTVNQHKRGYEDLSPQFVENYFRNVINHSQYPNGFKKNIDVQYINDSKALVVDFDLPHPEIVPSIIEYKYIQARKEIIPRVLKDKDFQEYYDSIIYQLAIRNVYECFISDYRNSTELVVFNGWIHGVDPSTGQEFHSCIISLQASREVFSSLNLKKVDPKECFRKLKGLNASSLYQLAPVRPIMHISREDKRFIESKEILADINSISNLAEMDWNDFEHLVRQLFEEYFTKDGFEVSVTQASRDGGIDAIAFNPDPILGGKIIIQAKKYNIRVPINDVRALNGVMAKENAMKGIMVTTSYFGKDSWEFVQNSTLTLIDGPRLIHMFQEIGYNVRIQLKKNQKR